MKLLAYHIENYGKIRDLDGSFPDGLTCFCEKNGFGKSTLASFLKAMFYGLPSYTAASKGFNDRQRYYPFSGGKFGGSLTFEYGGKEYRIERFFDKKSSKGDSCRVLQGGVDYDGFGEEIGKTVFGVDEDSFQKTAFITADEVEISSTHSINEKLGGAVEGDGGFAPAYKALEEAKKGLKAARGGNGKINVVKQRIDELTVRIRNLKDMDDGLASEYALREVLSAELAACEKEIDRVTAQEVVLEKWKRYDEKVRERADKEELLSVYQGRYPLGFPTAEERRSLQRQWQENNQIRGELQASSFSAESEESLRALEQKFANGVPGYELIDEMQEKISRLTVLQAERKGAQNAPETAKERELKTRFGGGLPTDEAREAYREVGAQLQRKEAELKEKTAELLRKKTAPKKKFEPFVYLLVLGVALLCGGAGLFFVMQTVGIGLLIAGGVFLVAGMVVKAIKPTMPPSDGENELVSLQAEIRALEERLLAFTEGYGYSAALGGVRALAALEEDAQAYRAALDGEAKRAARLAELETQAQRLEEECRAFLADYGIEEASLQTGLNKLSGEVQGYRRLQTERSNATAAKTELSAKREEGKAAINALLARYGLDASVGTMEGLNGLNADAQTYDRLTCELARISAELAEYQENNELDERPTEGADVQALRAEAVRKQRERANCDSRIADVERQVEALPGLENELALAKEELATLQEKYTLIEYTMSALKNAEQTLKDKYIKPIKDRFSTYAEALERVLDEKVSMTKDFEVTFERGGESRSERHLSAGERSLCALCLRLALVDNMYETELPFIIMDDPFVHLDEIHMERTKVLLRELAKHKQIIYFCCHDSRRV